MATAYPIVLGVRFKIVPEWPDYCAGSDGSIWSRLRPQTPTHGIMNNGWRKRKPARGRRGYLFVSLSHNGITIQEKVYRLILSAFVGPCPEGMQACHNDGNPANNVLNNLRWDTPSNNNGDKIHHGTWQGGSRNGNSKLKENDIRIIRALAVDGLSTHAIAEKFKVTNTMIRFIVQRKNWRHVQ